MLQCGVVIAVAILSVTVGSTIIENPTKAGRTIVYQPRVRRAVKTENCIPSITTARGNPVPCKDRLIFSEDFESQLDNRLTTGENNSPWTREIRAPLDPDYEFAIYREIPKNVKVEGGSLIISPLITDDEYGENATLFGNLQLGDICTSSLPAECNRRGIGYHILHPVISAQFTTKRSFSFRYGKVEIRAKFPKGDWLYPELWLEPKYKTQGFGYQNGRVILGLARGNENLFKNNSNFGSSLLEFGLRTGPSSGVREDKVTKRKDLGTWNEDFHTYTTVWNTTGFSFQVDGEEVGRLDAPPNGWLRSEEPLRSGNPMAPYDNEFYITLGLGVGGLRVFPDGTSSRGARKPWRNVEAKMLLRFWQAQNDWLPTWKDKNRVINANIQIDSVRVYSI